MITKTKPGYLLILGTASHVGKSAIVTAICRILSKEYRVAPFKAQNMSLNSWITADGKEIGIAQAIQAKAAGVEPTADMNPVLLKPKGDRQSQVIILGEPYADKAAGEYYDSIHTMHEILEGALRRLGEEYEIIVMEGAGGAAEINLYDRDIVNIGTARLTDAPIILVGDIERGGVFASLYGTLELLPDDVRANVKGFIINKFRGDIAILEPGLRQLEEKTGIPVLGVLPYSKLGIPSEDSVSIDDKAGSTPSDHDIEIAVIRFPRISNFTDFEPLENLAHIRYVDLDEDLGTPDAVILPGTKNTISDLCDLKKSRLYNQIKKFSGKGPIIGICGGYQMLGKIIYDSGVEGGENREYEGLGLLDIETTFKLYKKKTVQVTKAITAGGEIFDPIKGEAVSGYEIHMGNSTSKDFVFEDDGCIDSTGLIFGTYFHGLFENENIRNALIRYLYRKKGLEYIPEQNAVIDPYEDLADMVFENLDMSRLYEIAGLQLSQ
ncbi:cobyric acid synthase CobQ [Methanosalsum zhilinae DSM 4017]|uniref:Probable cobyric acid synthase n=1 Tax=Methanosalsum zhilinae (strain DSM 4017 / NBRC 107636 / OCM 62 / WeN5) TaxID=679901 RepID=F7XNA0_METZD|nr:cobyric acid synthase [Methanosalsum zhilinae]AEH60058.1 cobyric acid synthase CobQ [Methanosalsum zhilinae DSM 4017]